MKPSVSNSPPQTMQKSAPLEAIKNQPESSFINVKAAMKRWCMPTLIQELMLQETKMRIRSAYKNKLKAEKILTRRLKYLRVLFARKLEAKKETDDGDYPWIN